MSRPDSNLTISGPERQIVVGALDRLAVALADRGHVWSEGDQLLYEQALQVLRVHGRDGRPIDAERPDDDTDDDEPDSGEDWKQPA